MCKELILLANIILIYRKGVREHPEDYRSLHLTSVPRKVTQIVTGCIKRHLQKKAVIRHNQHGFMKGKSCVSNLISMVSSMARLPVWWMKGRWWT